MQIYLFEAENTGLYKIGVSKNAKKRIKQIQTGSAYKLKIIKTFDSKYAFKIESTLHRKLNHCRTDEYGDKTLIGEWFALEEDNIDDFSTWCESAHKGFSALENSNNPFF